MKTDIEIAQSIELKPIVDVVEKLGISYDDLARLYLLAQKEISAGGKDITNSIVQYPFGRIIDEISFFHHRLLLTL